MSNDVYTSDPATCHVHASGWIDVGGVELTRLPIYDDVALLFARLGTGPATARLAELGLRLPTVREYAALFTIAVHIEPYALPDRALLVRDAVAGNAIDAYRNARMRSRAWCERHDAEVWARLRVVDWVNEPVANAGKHWAMAVDGPVLTGWYSRAGVPLQHASTAHRAEPTYVDYATTFHAARSSTPAPRRMLLLTIPMMVGEDVRVVQRAVGAREDGVFGPATEIAVGRYQRGRGLLDDGVVGPRTWAAIAGAPSPLAMIGDPRAPACVAALRDADARWPGRSRASDGIMGDARHRAQKSDHNTGDAVDITHDAASGCSGAVIASYALEDERVAYVIWDRQIWSRARAAEGWRAYHGTNPHTRHVHISVRTETRADARHWGWAPR